MRTQQSTPKRPERPAAARFPRCGECRFFVFADQGIGECRAHPEWVMRKAMDWCGEFVEASKTEST